MSNCQTTACDPQAIPQIYQGEDKILTVRLVSAQTKLPFDISLATEIIAAFMNADQTTLEVKKSTGGITILNGPGGAMQITLTSVQTALLAVASGDGYQSFQLQITIGGKITIVQLPNSIQVIAPLFPI